MRAFGCLDEPVQWSSLASRATAWTNHMVGRVQCSAINLMDGQNNIANIMCKLLLVECFHGQPSEKLNQQWALCSLHKNSLFWWSFKIIIFLTYLGYRKLYRSCLGSSKSSYFNLPTIFEWILKWVACWDMRFLVYALKIHPFKDCINATPVVSDHLQGESSWTRCTCYNVMIGRN